MKKFTEKELRAFDGSVPGRPVYFAYMGKVYDITDSPMFMDGLHFEHPTGCDLTDYIEESPHGEEVLENIKVVGEYVLD